MRVLNKKQKGLLDKWFEEQDLLTKYKDLSLEQMQLLRELNDFEILDSAVNQYLDDLWANKSTLG